MPSNEVLINSRIKFIVQDEQMGELINWLRRNEISKKGGGSKYWGDAKYLRLVYPDTRGDVAS